MAKTKVSPILQMIRRIAEDQRMKNLPDQDLLRQVTNGPDDAAFSILLRRHGPMVLDVCRSVTGNDADAEDAFQATFLILAQKARSIRKLASVGSWLHGVAYRTALKAQAACAKRQKHEQSVARPVPDPPPGTGEGPGWGAADDLTWSEIRNIIHTELTAIAARYRAPLVLCFLEGKTQDQAANHLGISKATLKRRLEQGRSLLRSRLVRRGIGPTALVAASAWPAVTATACVSPALVSATVKAATALSLGQANAGLLSANVTYLLKNGLKAMLFTKLKMASAVVAAFALLPALGGWIVYRQSAIGTVAAKEAKTKPTPLAIGQKPNRPSPKVNDPQPPADNNPTTYSGLVVAPDGQPVPGAKLYLTPAVRLMEPFLAPQYATTGSDGRFKFTIPNAEHPNHQAAVVTASAAKYGVGWVTILKDATRDNLKLQLVNDDVPITAQIIDLEGKPVAGATLRVLQINAAPEGDLGPWLEAVKGKKGGSLEQMEEKYLQQHTIALTATATTDAEGRLKLAGIGRNRLVIAQLEGPTIATEYLRILTHTGKAITVPEQQPDAFSGQPPIFITYQGANFRHAAAPTEPIVGVVRDKDTKKPLAGITIRGHTDSRLARFIARIVKTTTDEQGCYRLVGLPKGQGNWIVAVPKLTQPYFPRHVRAPHNPGIDPVTVDVELKRGVWIEGKIFDKDTRKPVKGFVTYFTFPSNPNMEDYPGLGFTVNQYAGQYLSAPTTDDGSYRILGMPGPGLVGVYQKDNYLAAPERDDMYGFKERIWDTVPYPLNDPADYGAIARIDPAKGVDSVMQDVTLEPGWTFSGTVLGPDGKTLPDLRSFGLTGLGWDFNKEKKTAEFTVSSFNPSQPRDVVFQHLQKELVGVAQPPKKNGGSVTVRLQPAAGVKGRLVDAEGKPQPDIKLNVWFRKQAISTWHRYSPESIETDKNGRFDIHVLLPGYDFRLTDDGSELLVGGGLLSGQTKDLGDVQMKRTADPKQPEPPNSATVSGRVLDVAGKPAAGAKLFLLSTRFTPEGVSTTATEIGATANDGQFKVKVPKEANGQENALVAKLDGFGVDFIPLTNKLASDPVELRVVPDNAIQGRIINPEGKPVAGAKVSVTIISAYAENSLDSFLIEWKKKHPLAEVPSGIKNLYSFNDSFLAATTDADGRFAITGAGTERVVRLLIRGDGIAGLELLVANRKGFDPKPYNQAADDTNATIANGSGPKSMLQGPNLTLVVEKVRIIRGMVKDIDTGKPRVGVKVSLMPEQPGIISAFQPAATTDAEGKYEIRGARKAKSYSLVIPDDITTGHVGCQIRVEDKPGYEPIMADLGVKKGIIITGRVIDAATKKSLPGSVYAGVLSDNPFVKKYPELSGFLWTSTRESGDDTFRLVTLPGPIVLMGGPNSNQMQEKQLRYKPAAPDPKFPQYFILEGGHAICLTVLGPEPLQSNYCKVLVLDPAVAVATHDIIVEPATALPVRIQDADGSPLAGTWVAGIGSMDFYPPVRVKTDSCSAFHLEPGKPRLMVFYEPTKNLVGTLPLKGDEKQPLTVKLGPAGKTKGRLLDAVGKPLAKVVVDLHFRELAASEIHKEIHRTTFVETDADGKFQFDNVIPGLKFSLWLTQGSRRLEPLIKMGLQSVEAGAVLDLGEIKLKPANPGD